MPLSIAQSAADATGSALPKWISCSQHPHPCSGSTWGGGLSGQLCWISVLAYAATELLYVDRSSSRSSRSSNCEQRDEYPTCSALRHLVIKDLPRQPCNFISMVFQREVASVEQVQLRLRQVTKVGLRARCGEDCVVLSPNNQQRRLVLTEILLPLGVMTQIRTVVI